MAGRDTSTRFDGVYARHQKKCAGDDVTPCSCTPSYYGRVYDKHAKRYRFTKRYPRVGEALAARRSLVDQVAAGEPPDVQSITLKDACERFTADVQAGVALNKWGREYTESAAKDVTGCLRAHVLSRKDLARRHLHTLRRRDVQQLIDELSPTMSGSRVRSVVNAIRSLYTWAQDRELVDAELDPAGNVKLPAMDATPRDRVATPAEMAALLACLPLVDALPYALAAYAMGRRAQIQRLDWADVDIERGLIAWGSERAARKSQAAQRVVPAVAPLRRLIREAWLLAGKPTSGRVCPPKYTGTTSGLLNTGQLARRCEKRWAKAKLEPIGLHECRHTAATWLDHAGISPKVASVLMGHETPERQPGAAHITLARYTHVLPDAYEQARATLDRWLATETARARAAG